MEIFWMSLECCTFYILCITWLHKKLLCFKIDLFLASFEHYECYWVEGVAYHSCLSTLTLDTPVYHPTLGSHPYPNHRALCENTCQVTTPPYPHPHLYHVPTPPASLQLYNLIEPDGTRVGFQTVWNLFMTRRAINCHYLCPKWVYTASFR